MVCNRRKMAAHPSFAPLFYRSCHRDHGRIDIRRAAVRPLESVAPGLPSTAEPSKSSMIGWKRPARINHSFTFAHSSPASPILRRKTPLASRPCRMRKLEP